MADVRRMGCSVALRLGGSMGDSGGGQAGNAHIFTVTRPTLEEDSPVMTGLLKASDLGRARGRKHKVGDCEADWIH